MFNIAEYWPNVQRRLLPYLEEVVVPQLTPRLREFILVLDVVRLERWVPSGQHHGLGRPTYDRRPLARAFLAKAFFNLPTTEELWERLQVDEALRQVCGWERRKQVPSLSTFSRAFAEFAGASLLDQIHAALVAYYGADTLFFHISRDSTAIPARERPAPAPPPPAPAVAPPKPRRGRPRKDEVRPPKEPTRLERQYAAPLAETAALLAELPTACDKGCKKDRYGNNLYWVGYKFHVDVGDTGLPLGAWTTSASLHDSQIAIPLARRTASRVTGLYELMDAAYDAGPIHAAVRELGHVPIIEANPRRGERPPPLEPDRARHYCQRSGSERFNADLKDNHGGRLVRVRGHRKVHTHLMFGLLVIFAEAVLGWVP